MSANMVDWDLAVSIGSRVAGEGPAVDRAEAARVVAELRAGAERSTGLVRDFTGLVAAERTAPVLVVDRPGWVRANADGFATVIEPVVDKLAAQKGPPTGLAAGRRLAGHRRRGRPDPGLPRQQGARPVRPVLRPGRPAAAGRAQHRARRARARRRPARLPAVGVPARGDPPGAVHRRPVDAGAPVRARWRRWSTRSSRPGCWRTWSSGSSRRRSGGGASLLDLMSTPEQKEILDRVTGVMSLLEGHADVVMDGVGPDGDPVGGVRSGRSSTSAARGSGPSTGCCAGCSGWTRRWRSTATGPPSSAAVVDKVGHGGLQRRLGGARAPAPRRPRSPIPRRGSPASWAER